MQAKLVVRLLDAEDRLLGWAEAAAFARGDGCLWTTQTVTLMVEERGVPAQVSVHWADVNIEARNNIPQPHPSVAPGQVLTVLSAGPVFRVGPMPATLPAVTVRMPATVAPPAGGLAGAGRM